MDPLTHYMFAYVLGRKWNLERPQLKALTFAALLPDIDVITIVLGLNFLNSFHGTITHSILVAVLLALILSSIFYIYYRVHVEFYCMIGIIMHFLLDIIQTLVPKMRENGIMVTFPFSQEQFILHNYIPLLYSLILGVALVTGTFLLSIYFLYIYMKQKEYPWWIWLDERKILDVITGTKRNI